MALHRYSSNTYGYPPFNIATIGFSFLVGLLIAVGSYLWWETGYLSKHTRCVGLRRVLVYVILLIFLTVRSNFLVSIWTVTILTVLSAVALVLLAAWFYLAIRKQVA